MTSNHFVINVEAAIYKDGKWLVCIRSRSESEAPGLLSFIGGTVEHSDATVDTLEQALVREVSEEIGATIDVLGFANSSMFVSKKGNHVIDVVFLCRIKSGEPKISDTQELEELLWLTTTEVLGYQHVPKWLCASLLKAERIISTKGLVP